MKGRVLHAACATTHPRLQNQALTSCVVFAANLHHFKEPVMIVEGKQQYLFDERGRRYLDVRTCGPSVSLQQIACRMCTVAAL